MTGDLQVAASETHVGVVFLVGDRAYKMKKPVDMGFLDFSTRERRRDACRREVELNRRLAPDVYLGVADVDGPEGELCDHLVVMRRMPPNRRLSELVRGGAPAHDEVSALARTVAVFHAGAHRSAEVSAEGTRDAVLDRWQGVFEGVQPLTGTVPERIERLARRFLAGREQLFADRIEANRVLDGHGDLMADDVFCLEDGPRVLDCLEFDDRLRWLDGLDDAAFLAMDLERLERPDLAEEFLDRYAEFAADPAPQSLRHHYTAYRAAVRTRVACARAEQVEGTDKADSWQEADRYARLALQHLERGAVMLVLVGGLPGSGKSTVAGGLADRCGTVLLSSDRVRKELAGLDPAAPAPGPYRSGLYTPEMTERVYTELLERARAALSRGESVVLDASWSRDTHRGRAAELAEATYSDLVALRCRAPAPRAEARLRSRRGSESDADESVARTMAADEDPWPDAADLPTDSTEEDSVERAVALVVDGR